MDEKIVKDSQGLAKDLVNDCISRQAAIDAVLDRMNIEKYGRNAKPEEIRWTLEKLPSAQPERKRGHWAGIDDEPCETWECDQCGYIQECFDGEQSNFCPNCGAEMRGEQDG